MPLMTGSYTAGRVTVWQCTGCGKIEAPQPCIGVCQDRKTEMVYAFDYDEALVQVARVREQSKVFEALVRQLAVITPRAGEWERSYRALQAQARRALAPIDAGKRQ
jgi:DNA primase large subunit